MGVSPKIDPYKLFIFKWLQVLNSLNLKILAEDTGGISLQGMKKYENFQKHVNRDLTSYYELSYYPRRKNADGKKNKNLLK